MPIAGTDIDFHLSGGAANSDPNASIGGAISNTQITDASLHNLFDVVGSDEALAGDSELRCIYVKNNHATLTLQNAVIWIQSQTSSGDTSLEIALADEGIDGTAEVVADEDTDPVGEAFSAPATEGAALLIGNLPAQSVHAVWVRRNVGAAAAAFNNDTTVLRVKGDTAA